MRGPGQTYTEVSCDKAQQIDLLSFVSEPAGEGFPAFRKHYPLCPRCSAEVRAWNELHLALLETGGAAAHPGVESLAGLEASSTALSAEARREIESHLSACPACRDELGALRRFDPAGLSSPVAGGAGLGSVVGALLGRLRGMVIHPVFAYGVALLLLYPALQGRIEPSPTLRPAESAAEPDLPTAESFGTSSLRVERQTLAAEPEVPASQRARELRPEAALAEPAGRALEGSALDRTALAAPFHARFQGPALHLEVSVEHTCRGARDLPRGRARAAPASPRAASASPVGVSRARAGAARRVAHERHLQGGLQGVGRTVGGGRRGTRRGARRSHVTIPSLELDPVTLGNGSVEAANGREHGQDHVERGKARARLLAFRPERLVRRGDGAAGPTTTSASICSTA